MIGAAGLDLGVGISAALPEVLGCRGRRASAGAAAAVVAAGEAAVADAVADQDDQIPVVSGQTTDLAVAGLAPRGVQTLPVGAAAGQPDQRRLHHHHARLAF